MVTCLTAENVLAAQIRLLPYIHRTPLLSSRLLDNWLGHSIIFKAEGFQKIGAFKMRGALNTLLKLKEQGRLPQKVAAYSSGNHAQAVAAACGMLGVEAVICMPSYTSAIKQQATRAYGAKLELFETRQQAEAHAELLRQQGYMLIPPYDHDDVIAGQGTACLEALQDGVKPDAIFAPCGGGGLISGTWLAAQTSKHPVKVIAAEPLQANDAARSFRSGQIFTWDAAPQTIADGVQTLSISPRTFQYIRQLDEVMEISENAIIYWTQWLTHLLKVTLEPTAALGMAAAAKWLANKQKPQTVLVILSGANLAPEKHRAVWEQDHLAITPDVWSE